MMKEIWEAIKQKWFCLHKWKLWKTTEVETDLGSTYRVYHFYCEKCGKFKQIKSY
jgi:hypothetical protein